MIIRIVKMVFEEQNIDLFKQVFEERKEKIAGFEGCKHLQMLQDIHDVNTFFTYSYWINEEALNHYRHSELFKETWSKTKPLFAQPAEAWSVQEHFFSSVLLTMAHP